MAVKPFMFGHESGKGYKVCVFTTGVKKAREYITSSSHKDFKYLGSYVEPESSQHSTIAVRYPTPEPSNAYLNEMRGLVKVKDVDHPLWCSPRFARKHKMAVLYDEAGLMNIHVRVKGEFLKVCLENLPDNIVRCINGGDLSIENLSDDQFYPLSLMGWVEDEDTDQVWSFEDYWVNVYLPSVGIEV
jgi:hypothetical protein